MIKHIAKYSPSVIIGTLMVLAINQWFTIADWQAWVIFLTSSFLWAVYITWRDKILAIDVIEKTVIAISKLSQGE